MLVYVDILVNVCGEEQCLQWKFYVIMEDHVTCE